MRISENERVAICAIAEEVFGKGAKVVLFGSRVYDHLRGGDLDLYIRSSEPISEKDLLDKKINFLVKLKSRIGDRKIDVVLAEDPRRPIEKTAMEEGLPLNG